MAKEKPVVSRWQALLDIALIPAVAQLPAAVPIERRNVVARHALLCRVHREFEEMPGLSLTLDQAARMFGFHPDIIGRILGRLTDARVLRRRSDGQFTTLRADDVPQEPYAFGDHGLRRGRPVR